MSEPTLREAAENVMRLVDAYRDARNGQGHPGEPHDDVLRIDGQPFREVVGDCSMCAGRQYGIESEMNTAHGDLRAALGQERKPWETTTSEQWDRAMAIAKATP